MSGKCRDGRARPTLGAAGQAQLNPDCLTFVSDCVALTAQASQAELHAYLTRLTNLQELQVPLELTAATLAALAPLTALTRLYLVRLYPSPWSACSGC